MPMDDRIGYGLTFDEALKLVAEIANNIPNETVSHINISTDHHGVIWAELRVDGWRVYKSPHIPSNSSKEEAP